MALRVVYSVPYFQTLPEVAYLVIVMTLAISITAAFCTSRTMLTRIALLFSIVWVMRLTDPLFALYEAMLETAFATHPYGHTTMGYERDIAAMPQNSHPIALPG